MSIFLTTPAFLFIFKVGHPKPLVISAWAGLISVLIPLWMYHTTGYAQFGYRYILDVIVFIFILLASNTREVGRLEKLAIFVSIIVNAVGMVAMFNLIFKIDWFQMWIGIIKKIFTILFLR